MLLRGAIWWELINDDPEAENSAAASVRYRTDPFDRKAILDSPRRSPQSLHAFNSDIAVFSR